MVGALAESPDHVIPGHDPLIVERFPAFGGDPLIREVSASPLKASPLHR